MNVTGTALIKIFPALKPNRAAALAALINEVCPAYGIDTSARLAAFLAQVGHESGCFGCKEENLNYSAQRLAQIFPKYFSAATAAEYGRHPEKIANRVYGGRMGNGPEASGDGYKYRGGGFIQLTGKDTYKSYASFRNADLDIIVGTVRTDDKAALDSACWFFAKRANLLDKCDKGDFIAITKGINGGTIGLAERQKLYAAAKAALAGTA